MVSSLVRYHVSPSQNRSSIREHGLDWRRMDPELSGIANGEPGRPEVEGVYLSHEDDIADARFFVRMGNGRSVDVWAVDMTGIDVESGPRGWWVCRAPIEPERLRLVEAWETDAFGDPRAVPGVVDPLVSRRKAKRRSGKRQLRVE